MLQYAEQTDVRDKSILELLARPRDVLLKIKSALEAQDHVLLADLLQYEFTDVSEDWHTIINWLKQQAEDLAESPG